MWIKMLHPVEVGMVKLIEISSIGAEYSSIEEVTSQPIVKNDIIGEAQLIVVT